MRPQYSLVVLMRRAHRVSRRTTEAVANAASCAGAHGAGSRTLLAAPPGMEEDEEKEGKLGGDSALL
jgi:hypothetical protein